MQRELEEGFDVAFTDDILTYPEMVETRMVKKTTIITITLNITVV